MMFEQNEPFRFNFASDDTTPERIQVIGKDNDAALPAEELLLFSQVHYAYCSTKSTVCVTDGRLHK